MAETITQINADSDVVLVRVLVDRLDEESVKRFTEDVRSAAAASSSAAIVIDLSKVSFIPSLSLGALVRLSTDARSRQQRLILAGLQPDIRQVFIHTRLDRLFEMQSDVAAATKSARSL